MTGFQFGEEVEQFDCKSRATVTCKTDTKILHPSGRRIDPLPALILLWNLHGLLL